MPVIKAFVGHSFRPVDKPVVDAILDVLNRVKQLRSDFDWDHALEPEPKTIDAKVLALFQDKTLFVGICTRAERAIADQRLARFWGRRYAEESAFEWKASDWLLQEIGLSIGRGMNIILLVEKGTREPGDLQGNWERVEFDRSAPEKCYVPLLGMIAKLAGKAGGAVGSTVIDHPAQVEPVPPASPEISSLDIWHPDDTWTFQTYQVAFRVVTSREGPDKAEKIASAFAASPLATDQNRATWKAFLQLTQLRAGHGSLAEVVAHAAAHPKNADIAVLVAQAYVDYGESGEAASWYERASDLSSDAVDQIYNLRRGVVTALKGGKDALYASLQAKLRLIEPKDIDSLKARLSAELEVAEEQKEYDIAIASLEKLLSLDPSDNEHRFNLAYKYSHTGRSDMAALHYERIPAPVRTSAGWNNLGVAYDGLSFAIRAVDAYRRAADAGETLAASNIAKRFLDAGFVQEASNLLEDASRKPEHDKLVDTRFAEVKEARDDEGKERDKLLPKSRATSDFYAAYGEARLARDLPDVAGLWKTPRGTATVVLSGTDFVATNDEPVVGLLSLGMARHVGAATTDPIRRVLVTGRLVGRTIAATISEADKRTTTRSLFDAAGDQKALIWVSPSSKELHFMEGGPGDMAPKFYSWHHYCPVKSRTNSIG
jgi:tetratricopeptide (TPR) repeat protein